MKAILSFLPSIWLLSNHYQRIKYLLINVYHSERWQSRTHTVLIYVCVRCPIFKILNKTCMLMTLWSLNSEYLVVVFLGKSSIQFALMLLIIMLRWFSLANCFRKWAYKNKASFCIFIFPNFRFLLEHKYDLKVWKIPTYTSGALMMLVYCHLTQNKLNSQQNLFLLLAWLLL